MSNIDKSNNSAIAFRAHLMGGRMATNIFMLVLVVAATQMTGCTQAQFNEGLKGINETLGAGTLVSYSTVDSIGEGPGSVRAALLVPDDEDDRFNVLKTNLDVEITEEWRLDAMASSENYLALGLIGRTGNASKDLDGKLEIYINGTLKHRFDDKDLENLILNASNKPSGFFRHIDALHPFDLGFESERTLVVYVQPQGGDDTRSNILLKLDVETGKAIGEVEFFNRSPRRSPPSLPENSRFSLTVTNGVMSIGDQVLDELPNNINETLFTQSTLGN